MAPAKRSMVPCSTMPKLLDMALPSAAAAKVEKPKRTQIVLSMRSPDRIIRALSVIPKPMNGIIVCIASARSCWLHERLKA